MTTAILFGSFLLLLLIGVPIGIALGAASMSTRETARKGIIA